MAFAGAVERMGSLQPVGTVVSRRIDAGRRGQTFGCQSVFLPRHADESVSGTCSTSGRTSLRGQAFRRRATAPVFVEMGHEDFYSGSFARKRGVRSASGGPSAVLLQEREGQLGDIYERARNMGRAEDLQTGMLSQEDMQSLSTEVKKIRQRLDSMEKTMKRMKDSSSSSSSSSSSESSSSSDGMGKKVKRALKQEAKRRKADRKAASKGLKSLRARAGALMVEGFESGSGMQLEAAAMGTMTATDMLRAAAAVSPAKAGKVEVCMSGKCRKYGGMDLLHAVNAALPAGSMVEASPCKCLGKCGSGPNLKVRPEGASSTLHTHAKPSDVEALLCRHFGLRKDEAVPSSPRIPAVAAKKVLELVR